MKILLLFATLTAGAAETNIFNKLNFGGSLVSNRWPPVVYSYNGEVFIGGSWPTNIVISNSYTGTIQIGTNFYKVSAMSLPPLTIEELVASGQLCAKRGHVWGDNPKLTAFYESNPGRSRKCVVCGLVQSQQPGEWK